MSLNPEIHFNSISQSIAMQVPLHLLGRRDKINLLHALLQDLGVIDAVSAASNEEQTVYAKLVHNVANRTW